MCLEEQPGMAPGPPQTLGWKITEAVNYTEKKPDSHPSPHKLPLCGPL